MSAVLAASVAGLVLGVRGVVGWPRGNCGGLWDAVVLQPAPLPADIADLDD